MFFSDIVNFTSISEKMDPDELGRFLNYYLTTMSELVLKYGGTIDKFIGDAIMVFFGDPSSEGLETDASNCFHMAVEMQEILAKNRENIRKEYNLPEALRIRVGIHTGKCNVGNFGSDQRLEYTAIGRTVNIASRLEHACEESGILCSKATYVLLQTSHQFSDEKNVSAKGIENELKAYSWQRP